MSATAAPLAATDLFGRALADPGGAALWARDAGGGRARLPVERWLREPDAADVSVVASAPGPVLDVGCGPGRHLAALASLGIPAAGVDICGVAVAAARRRGALAFCRSVFDPLPFAGEWGAALLLDGNVGIGGDPGALLRRVARLLRRGGRVLVELAPPGRPGRRLRTRLEHGAAVSEWFSWATLGVDDVRTAAATAGLDVDRAWSEGGRWFASATPRAAAQGSPGAARLTETKLATSSKPAAS